VRTPAWEGAKALAPAKSAKRVIVLVYCDLQKEHKVSVHGSRERNHCPGSPSLINQLHTFHNCHS